MSGEYCYNTDCEDHNASATNGCFFSTNPKHCLGYADKEAEKKKEEEGK